ncbi:MAG TPA: hypothetical protein VKP64_02825 [Mycobacteriales bacterium]|nr:hypothetical protein [Mycobacteriales bacterium]
MSDRMPTPIVVEEAAPPSPPARPRRRRRLVVAVVAVLALVGAVVAGLLLARRPTPVPAPAPSPAPTEVPTPPAASKALCLPRLLFGFYAAGLQQSRCYGSCQPGDNGYEAQEATRARIRELRRMGVNYVVNNQGIAKRFERNPQAYYELLADLHRNGIRVSYSVASGGGVWYDDNGRFDPSGAEREFARTDLNGDGVSDLDGRLDVLFLGHEVMEYAVHADRVRMYDVAKKWFPTTPVSVYYGGFMRPFEQPGRDHPKAGTWRDYQYGPGETDIVHATVTASDGSGGFDPNRFAAEVRTRVQIVQRLSPGVPVVLHTSFAGDDRMDSQPDSMWSPQKLRQWYDAMVSVPGIRGVLLRSYDRFTYDLANPSFSAERATWTALGADAARRNGAAEGRRG